eukprot:scaffold25492_cov140-Isochrysis_galbana.AAC.4
MVWVGGRAKSRKLTESSTGGVNGSSYCETAHSPPPRPRDSGRCVDANPHPSRAARTKQKEKRNAKGGRGARRTLTYSESSSHPSKR